MAHSRSKQLYAEAQKYLPAGVNSPVRSFAGVGGEPLFIESGSGAYLHDVDGNSYIDYVLSWGPMIVGHAHPVIISAVQKACEQGLSFGAPTEIEILLAKKISELMPSIELIRMVNSGTEATMSALRVARGFTNRHKIIKFEGCYHGHSDALLVKAGSGSLTFGVPSSAGVPEDVTQHTLTATFNDLDSVVQCFENYPEDIACIILEPIAGNMNCIPAKPEFIRGLRELCDRYQSLLIFDEVMTGFRVALGGAQAFYNVKPDLTCLGKVIGGGMPVGAFGGRKDIMQVVAPLGPVYQAGTLAGNPIAMTAGLVTLELIEQKDTYKLLNTQMNKLLQGLQNIANRYNIPFTTQQAGSMFGLFFIEDTPISFDQVKLCNSEHFKKFFHAMLKHGVYLAPSLYEAGFLSTMHTDTVIDETLTAANTAMKIL